MALILLFKNSEFLCRTDFMKFSVGDVIKLKKQHPCGANQWEILRVGMDFRLKCQGCDRQVMLERKIVEKNFKGFIKKVEENA